MKGRSKQKLGPFDSEFYAPDKLVREMFSVSVLSKWADPIWRLGHNTPGQPAKKAYIRWDVMLGNASLIEDSKLFIWSLLTENMRGRANKTTSIENLGACLRRFLKWMDSCGIERFSDLPERFGFVYLEAVLDTLGSGTVTEQTIGRILDLPVRIYEQSQVLHAAGRDGIAYHPFGGQSAYELASNYGTEPERIPPVPDELFVATSAEVFNWIDQYSKDIVRAVNVAVEARRSGPQYEKWRAFGVNKALQKFRFKEGGDAWHKPFGDNPTTELRELLADLRGACMIAVQAFVGVRINELLSLEAEPRQVNTDWPACLSMRSSRNGLLDIFYIKGRLAKARDEYDVVEWVAGARPAGTKYLPPAVKAVIVLEKAFRAWRNESSTRLVVCQKWGGRGLPDNLSMSAISYNQAAYEQVNFIRKHIYDVDPELAKSVNWWRVSTHQWRKSFAQYVVRSDETLLRAVSEHFKHVSLAMTSEDYVGNDIELLGYLEDQGLQRAAEIMIDLASGSTYGSGPLADLVQERSSNILGLADSTTREDRVRSVREVLQGDNVRAWGCDWGECLYRPESARCRAELSRNVDLSTTRPNTITRRPSLCCDCGNLVVLRQHMPFWQKRRTENLAILERESDKNSPSARTAKSRVEQCDRILRKLAQSKKKKSNGA